MKIYQQIQPIDIVATRESPCNDVQLFDAMDSIDSMLREIQDGNNAPIRMDLVIPKVTDTVSQTIEDVIDKINKFICFECGKQFHRYMSYKQHWGTQSLLVLLLSFLQLIDYASYQEFTKHH